MTISEFWQGFIGENEQYIESKYTAWRFGVNPDVLAQLVLDGTKTVTCSGLRLYDAQGEALPESGDISIVLNSDEEPKCVIENTQVYTIPFKDVEEDVAYKEGEGDRTLAYWRNSHLEFFVPEYKSAGLEFEEDDLIVVEEFKLIYK